MNLKVVAFLAMLSVCKQSIGLVSQTIDEFYPLQVCFSKSSYNRITVEDGAIKKIIAQEGLFDIELDNVTGQAFVTVKEFSNGPLALSVITDSGCIQDLVIETAIKSPEVVLLREKSTDPKPNMTAEEKAIHTIHSIVSGKMPFGYVIARKDDYTSRNYGFDALGFHMEAVYEGPFDRIVVFKVTNQTPIECRLQEKHLAFPEDSWIYLRQETLSPGQSTKCIICQKKGAK